YAGGVERERLVVHEQFDDFAVGHIQHGLSHLRKTESLFAVNDRPGLIKSVYERAVLDVGASLFLNSPPAEGPLPQSKDGLHLCQKLRSKVLLDQTPFIGGIVLRRWLQTFVMKHSGVPLSLKPLVPMAGSGSR